VLAAFCFGIADNVSAQLNHGRGRFDRANHTRVALRRMAFSINGSMRWERRRFAEAAAAGWSARQLLTVTSRACKRLVRPPA
jgi:hypothetical protein